MEVRQLKITPGEDEGYALRIEPDPDYDGPLVEVDGGGLELTVPNDATSSRLLVQAADGTTFFEINQDGALIIQAENGQLPLTVYGDNGESSLGLSSKAGLQIASAEASDPILFVGDETSAGKLLVYANGRVVMPDLPTANPNVAGALWNDSGTLRISAG